MGKPDNNTMEKLLFICRFNQMRSRTAEQVFSAEKLYQVRSAGTDRKAVCRITGEHILWADMIFVMEDEQEEVIREKFPDQTVNKKIFLLDIPDNYCFMDPELVELLNRRVTSIINTMENWKHLRILIVEDNRIQSFVISKLLADTGIQITNAFNGKEAVDLFANEKFDIILMNIKMPVMDGFEATKEIRKLSRDVPVIAETNWGGIREKCLEEGFDDYIRKPFGRDDIIEMIKKHINV
jgi:two-component system cell cycle response regulator DivK